MNEGVQPWKFKYETLKSVPLIMNKGEWLLTCDLEDAYHRCLLTEDSRNLFGGKVNNVMAKEQWRKLKAEGFAPEDVEQTP